jgi:hypothetical protein
MTTCAVVDSTTGLVISIIVCEPTDPAPDGTYLVEYPDADGNYAGIGYFWNGVNFINPNPPDPLPPPPQIPE